MGRPSRYPEEFRREAVQLALSSDESRAAVARTYGAPRVHAELARLARRCGPKRVARLMRAQGLVGVHARRRWRRGGPDVAPAADLVARDFNPSGPDRLWAADVTQFRTDEGWLHLAAVVDLWSRRVVGWAMDNTVTIESWCRTRWS